MNKRNLWSSTALILIAVLLMQTGVQVQAQDLLSEQTGLQMMENTTSGLVLELAVPEMQLEKSTSDRGPCILLRIPGWGMSSETGEPTLPVTGTLVAVPLGARPTIEVLETGPMTVQENVDLCPAATLLQSDQFSDIPVDLGERLIVNKDAYASDRVYPGQLALLGELSMIRSQQVVQVLFQPIRYNPVTRQLTTYSSLRVRVDFGIDAAQQTSQSVIDEGPYEDTLRSQVINYEDARAWRIQPKLQSTSPSRPSTPSCKISVTQDGMVRVTYDALNAVCPQIASQDPRTFQLFDQDSEVAIQVPGESDRIFGSEDSLIFYGQKTNTRYTDTNVYWLTAGVNLGLRMNTSDGAPNGGNTPTTFIAKTHREENHIYLTYYPSGPDNNRWYWNVINIPTIGPKTYTIYLTNVATTEATARIRGFLKGYAASPQHHSHISINGHLISQEFWPARTEFFFDVAVPQSYLTEGANTILVEAPLTDGITVNQILVDWFEIDYAKTYTASDSQSYFNGDSAGTWEFHLSGLGNDNYLIWDITDPLNPVSINNAVFTQAGSTYNLVFQQTIQGNHQYLTTQPANLLSPANIIMAENIELHLTSNEADYIIITPPSFSVAIIPLVNLYTQRGLHVKVVDVNLIYDEFSDGELNPTAIHDFLEYSYTNWKRPAPSFVLLVGDGNYDFKNFKQYNDPIFIPPFLAEVDPWLGETAADNRYVTVNGNDILPDIALGRLPVRSDTETTAIVNKIISHYQTITGEWSNIALFVAGANDPSAGNFPVLSDNVIETYLPDSVQTNKVYFGFSDITSGSLAKQAITTAINDGSGLIHFVGHSNPYAWYGDINSSNPASTVMLDNLTGSLFNNPAMYPIFISMTCFTGFYILPGDETLDELLIRSENKGAVATWSPTGKGVASGHDLLDAGFFTAIYTNHVLTLGMATNAAKYYLYANSSGLHRELIDTYILFGDPAMLYKNTPTAVDLNYFQAGMASGGVQLSWETVAETTLGGFNIYRRELNGDYIRVNPDLILPQKGGQSEGSVYTHLDTGALPGVVYEYQLDVIENSMQVLLHRTTLYWPFAVQLPVIRN